MELEQVIAEFPLSTDALRITPKAIALLQQKQFDDWLLKIKQAAKRADDLVQNEPWNVILLPNEGGQPTKVFFTFLHLSQLP